MNDLVRAVLRRQSGMVARRQLTALGVDWDAVDHQIRARRWVARTPRVLSTFTGALTVDQRLWAAVLHAGPRSMLGGLSAAGAHGLAGWHRDEVTVLVDDELSFEPVAGVRFFRSRRPFEVLASARPGIPRCQVEPAILLWAGYVAAIRPAHGVLAASVQQRLTTPERLVEWIDLLQPLRRAKQFKRTIGDIAGGSHSGAELDVVRMCRHFHLPRPQRQRLRTDTRGRVRWTDCEWDLPDGSTLVLEVDGAFHIEAAQWQDDLRRARRVVGRHRILVRCTAYELRHEPVEVARDLVALGLRGRVPDDAA